ncbi:capsule assembly Wzi family protein [Dyadobacter crusticola]|uniref:capsule assembly Wzi family protein n=1 Tax=Dyadobacter crusticola TaxID=292407 RepID=UPI000A0088F1|nr:capsule assembly Wzi family protein [Dyadobacter crusticola]
MPLPRIFTITFTAITFLWSVCSFGQKNSLPANLSAKAELGVIAASNKTTPFWLRTNQFGVIPTDAPAALASAAVRRNYVFYDSVSKKARKFDWSASVNPVLVYSKANDAKVLLPEAYASVRFKNVEFYAGRRMELMGLGDSTMSMGFYSGSGNALPIPKVQIGTIGFTPLKFTKNFLAIHAGFSHGWFATNYLEGVRLHQKFMYFRFGKPKSNVKVYAGLNHNVLWAGQADYLKNEPDLAKDGKFPSSWSLYPNIVFAYTPKNWYEKNGYGAFDSYRLGNHLGSYDFGVEAKVLGYNMFVYHQHPFEDVSSMIFKNVPDGLFGVSFKTSTASAGNMFRLTRLTLEFLTTKDQSGSTFYIPGSKFQGADNYLNHSQYTQGWSYQGNAVGTPFIIPGKDMDQSKPKSGRFYPNNRVNVWYAGAQANLGNSWQFGFRGSFSRNFGTPGASFEPPRSQLSLLASAGYKLPKLRNTSLIARLSTDSGEIFRNSTGGFLGISRIW